MDSPHIARRLTWLYGAAMFVALLGLADALYLTVQHLGGHTVPCGLTGGCTSVLTSKYASLGGIPTAALGAAAYFTAFSLATLAVFGYGWARGLLLWFVVAMVLTTLWLLYLQAFVLRAFCQYCLLSAGLTLTLAGLAWAARASRAET